MEWQPIETAPKDGTWVLVYGAGTDDEAETRNIAVAQYTNYLNGSTYNKYWWQFAWYDGGYYGRFNNPTHWMPLPEAPNTWYDGGYYGRFNNPTHWMPLPEAPNT